MKKYTLSNNCFLWSMIGSVVLTFILIFCVNNVDGIFSFLVKANTLAYFLGIIFALIFALIIYVSLDEIVEYGMRNGTLNGYKEVYNKQPFIAYLYSLVMLVFFTLMSLSWPKFPWAIVVGIGSALIVPTLYVGIYLLTVRKKHAKVEG